MLWLPFYLLSQTNRTLCGTGLLGKVFRNVFEVPWFESWTLEIVKALFLVWGSVFEVSEYMAGMLYTADTVSSLHTLTHSWDTEMLARTALFQLADHHWSYFQYISSSTACSHTHQKSHSNISSEVWFMLRISFLPLLYKLPQTQWPETTNLLFNNSVKKTDTGLTGLSVGRTAFLLEALVKNPFHCLFQLLEDSLSPWFVISFYH
jgi:hypothetical protein